MSGRRLDFGIASYRNPGALRNTLESLERTAETDWRCFIVHNPSDKPDEERTKEVICGAAAANPRFVPVWLPENVGYAGAVNEFFHRAETEYLAYADNDVNFRTPGWDEAFCQKLDAFHEVGWIFPNIGPYMIDRNNYMEIMWSAGFCWILSRMALAKVGPFDESLGHQEEADYALRLRMAGFRVACVPDVKVDHLAAASSDPASIERINAGVVKWVDKWNRYFNGERFNYFSPNVTRFDDWPPNALYLEEYFKLRLANDFNFEPEVVKIDGREYDLIKVPRLKGYYRGRII